MAAHVRDTGKSRGSGVASINLSFAALPAAGNMVAVEISNYNNATDGAVAESLVTDNQSNTYLRAVQSVGATGDDSAACIHYDESIGSPSGTFTITVSPTGTNYLVAVGVEYTGIAASPLDKTQVNNGTSNSPSSGTTAALAQANNLVIAVLAVGGTDTTAGIDAATGYTNRCIEQDANTYGAHSTDDKEVSATTAVSASWGTLDGSYPWSACIATFKLSGGGGGAVTNAGFRSLLGVGK